MIGKALQDVGTAGYGGFAEPAVNAPGLRVIGIDYASSGDWHAVAAWRGRKLIAIKTGISAGSTAGLEGNLP